MKKLLLITSLLSVFCMGLTAQTILGVDVSHYQGTITWSQVKSPGGKTFAWAKATEGVGYTDANYVGNTTNGTTAGVVMGAYHFAHPETNTAAAEASYFLSVAGSYIVPGSLPPALDLEDPSGGTPLTTYYASNPGTLTTWVVDWCTAVKNATGVTPVIYVDGSVAAFLGSAVTVYPLWIADPDNSQTAPPATTGVWSTWAFKQYSWTGTVSGISGTGAEDLDVFNGTTNAFNTLIGAVTTVTPNFTASVPSVCTGGQVTYTDHSTSTGTITNHKWTFQDGTPATSTATNPVVTYNTAGTFQVKEVVTSTTGIDSLTKLSYIHVIPSGTLPLTETFQSGTFPPTGWTMNYPQAYDSAWELCTYNGYNSSQCMYFPGNCGVVHNIAGQYQQIYTPDYSFATTTNAKMRFDVAYEPYNSTFSDTLAIYYSLDCGDTWTQVYLKGGATLCTTGTTIQATNTDTISGGCFSPPNTQAWRTDSINLSAIDGDASVMFSFESRSGWGNIIYIDNINVAGTTVVACTPPAAPVAVSPGTASGPGSNATTSVTMEWNSATGATAYYPRIAQCPYGSPNLVFADSCYTGGLSESATLAAGNLYRWNIGAFSQCSNDNCESDGNTLYFNIPPVLASTGSTTFCPDDSVKLSTTAGNTVSTPEFYWYLNGTLVDSTTAGTYYAKQTGNYTAAISYSCGATGQSNSIAVDVLTPPAAPTIQASPGNTNCGPIQLTAGSIGCNSCTYSWSNGSTGSTITVNTTGTYHVTATSSGCASTGASVTVTVNQPPTVSASPSSQQVCINQSVTLTATGTATSYQWSGTGLLAAAGSSVNAQISVTGNQTYTVTATLNGCTATASTSVSINSSVVPVVTITQTTANPVCAGSQVSFSASPTNGGNGPVYQWVSGSQTGTGSTFTLNNATNGAIIQCLLISDAGCASPDSAYSNTLSVTTQTPQPVTLSVSTPDTNVCSGENIAFTSSATNAGNNPTYSWYANGSLQSGNTSSFSLNNIQSNTTVYCVVSASGGCETGSPATSNTENIHIQTSAQASVTISAGTNAVCAGTPLTFTAIPGNGGASPTYAWALNGNSTGSNSATYGPVVLQNGNTVSCSMTSTAGCVTNPNVVSNTVTMQVNPLPAVNAGGTLNVPSTTTAVTLGGNPTASGGTTPYTYVWGPATDLNSVSAANPVAAGLTASTVYNVTVTDANGCTASGTVNVNIIMCTLQGPAIQVNFCDLAAQNITGAAYQWYLQGSIITGAVTRFYTATQTGYYDVKVNDTLGCTAQSADTYIAYPACLTTGIEPVSDKPEFDIYPNPASSDLMVALSNTMPGTAHIEIFDVWGQLVYTGYGIEVITGNKYPINISSFSAGVYMIRITNNENRFAVKRFIKL